MGEAGGFKRIENEKEKKLFEDIWQAACDEKGFKFEKCTNFTESYFLHSEQAEIVGTVEFVPYNPKVFSTIEKLFPFSKNMNIKQHRARTYEIDKLSIIRDERGKQYLTSFIRLFYNHSVKNNVKYYIALIEVRFFKVLKRVYGINIEQLGEPVIEKESTLVPIMINAEFICDNIELFPWYNKVLKEPVQQV